MSTALGFELSTHKILKISGHRRLKYVQEIRTAIPVTYIYKWKLLSFCFDIMPPPFFG